MPGCAFAAATISCMLFTGTDGFAASSCGRLATSDTGAKSRSVLNGSLYIAGLMVCDESVKSTV